MSGKAVSLLLALVALPAVAFAADPQSQKGPLAAPPLIYSWEGAYLGAQVGYSFNMVSEQGTDLAPGYLGASGALPTLANPVFYSQDYSSRGVFTGVHFGYDKQYGSLVLGLEGDIDYAGMNTDKIGANSLALGLGGPYGANVRDNFRWGVVGRAGWANNRALYLRPRRRRQRGLRCPKELLVVEFASGSDDRHFQYTAVWLDSGRRRRIRLHRLMVGPR